VGAIGRGLTVLVGIEQADTPADLEWMADKVVNLRIFEDAQEKMNLSVKDVGGGVLLVPNFTLAGDARKGRRPSFDNAMRPEQAEGVFAALIARVKGEVPDTVGGVFRAHMNVSLVNDGPVTIVISSR